MRFFSADIEMLMSELSVAQSKGLDRRSRGNSRKERNLNRCIKAKKAAIVFRGQTIMFNRLSAVDKPIDCFKKLHIQARILISIVICDVNTFQITLHRVCNNDITTAFCVGSG